VPDSPLYPGGPTWEEILNSETNDNEQMTWE
jgi:hypothetical protein